MIKHIVCWKLKDENKKENCAAIKQGLEALVGVVDGLRSAEVGINCNPDGYDLALVSLFDSQAALDAYQTHPQHVRVRDFVTAVRTARVVVDYEISVHGEPITRD